MALAGLVDASVGDGCVHICSKHSPSLWSHIQLLTGDFLFGLYRDGMLSGNKPSEAYFVRCNAETNTALAIAAGRLNILVGLALLRPAEFEVLNISLQCVPPSRSPATDG